MAHVNITSGEMLNAILKTEQEEWIPFNEAMSQGSFQSPLFSSSFCKERSCVHGVDIEAYFNKMSAFLTVIENLHRYESMTLWFGSEPFCRANYSAVIEVLRLRQYNGTVTLNIVNETNGELLSSQGIDVKNSKALQTTAKGPDE